MAAYFNIKKGLSSALPSTKKEGTVYFTTDNGKLYIDTNSTTRVGVNAIYADTARMTSRTFDRDSSNALNLVTIYDTNKTTLRGLIGFHNTGGDGTGSAYIIPYPVTTDTWSGTEGLYIKRGELKIDNAIVLTSSNYSSYTVTKTGSGASGTWGINVTGSAGSVAWGNITGKPSTYTPSSHTHSYLPLSGGTLSGNINFQTIASWPTVSGETYPINSAGLYWNGSSDTAKIFYRVVASDSGHLIIQMGDATDETVIVENNSGTVYAKIGNGGVTADNFYGTATLANKLKKQTSLTSSNIDNFLEDGVVQWATADNSAVGENDGLVMSFGWSSQYGAQLWLDDGSGEGGMKIRNRGSGGTSWNPWRQVLTEHNYTSYTVTKTGSGASGTWGISVTGSSASCTGNAATATKATQDANGATISSTYLKLSGGTMTGHITMNGSNQIKSAHTGSSYWKARDLALVRHTAHTASSSYSPIYSMKGLSGDFACGLIHYSSGESKIEWRYTTDATYNAGLNDGSSLLMQLDSYGSLLANKVYGAVWNDYAEYRSGASTEPGKVVKECSDGILRITESRLEPGCEIISDTFGFAIGKTDECKTPVATSGRVLAYPFEDRDTFELGQAVCSGPNGTVSKMTREEIMMYPERIIGTVSEIPQYEIWGTGNVSVNGRIWIRIR